MYSRNTFLEESHSVHLNNEWDMGGKGAVENNPEVSAWGTWRMVVVTGAAAVAGARPVLDVSPCLKDICLERCGSSRPACGTVAMKLGRD